jgi:segregation and condensation protein B
MSDDPVEHPAVADTETGPVHEPVNEPVTESGNSDGGDEQIAFDINEFPGGARSALEAVLMVVDEPVTEVALASALELPVEDVRAHLHALEGEYATQQRGFTLRSVAGGWRVYSRADYAPVVEKFVLDGQQAKLTQASLETLAVIAYRQPVSRARVGAVRGVNVDGVVRTLMSRGLVEEVEGTGETGAVLYRTTPYFLQRLGLGSLDELPALAPYLPDADVIDELLEEGHA